MPAITGTGYGLIGVLVIILLVVPSSAEPKRSRSNQWVAVGRSWEKRKRSLKMTEVNQVSNADDAKGRTEEAAGDLTDNDDLKREGKLDRATGAAKDKLDEAADKVKDAVTSDD